jgi:predicted AAA+ superfamily ATPase
MYVTRKQLENLRRLAIPGKVVVIYGARRTGKTTLLNEFLKQDQPSAAAHRFPDLQGGVLQRIGDRPGY